jgi:hypothetical protein
VFFGVDPLEWMASFRSVFAAGQLTAAACPGRFGRPATGPARIRNLHSLLGCTWYIVQALSVSRFSFRSFGMFEFFSWIAAILAITWSRKKDVEEILAYPESREAYAVKLVSPNVRFNSYLSRFDKFLEWLFGDAGRMFLFCLMFALIYSSSVFLFNLAFSKSDYGALGVDPIAAWKTKLLFVGIVIATAIAFGGARFLSKPSLDLSIAPFARGFDKPWYRTNVRSGYFWRVHLACALYYTFAIWLVFGNLAFTLVSLVVALTAARSSTTRLNHQQQFDHFKLGTIAGAGLGGHGLLVALLFFTSTQAGWPIYTLIMAATLLSAALAAIAVASSICANNDVSGRKNWNILSLAGRPALYVGFYCSRAAGSFCFAVGTLLIACYLMERVGHFPRELIVPASVILTSAIFLAGATTVSGAGAFALLIMLIVTIFLAIVDPKLLFQEWSYLVIFWFLFPILNASFDFVRWQIVRQGIKYRLGNARLSTYVLFMVDLLVGILAITAFTYVSVLAITTYNHQAIRLGFEEVIPVRLFLEAAHTHFWDNGVWLLLMVSTMLLPTFANLAIFLAAGSIEAVPRHIRERLANELRTVYATDTKLGQDRLAWQIAAVDSFAGVIFIVGVSVAVIYLTVWIAPAFGEFLYFCASKALG